MSDLDEELFAWVEQAYMFSEKKIWGGKVMLSIGGLDCCGECSKKNGFFVNLEYTLANGQSVKLLDDNGVYWGSPTLEEIGEYVRIY